MSRILCSLAVLIGLSVVVPAANAADSADELVGLWKASRWFGPRVRGTLVVERSGQMYRADIAGRNLPVKVANGELSFELPNDEGMFRGKLETGGAIAGRWIQPRALAGVFASPARLAPDGRNRWSGQVRPFEDTFTFYLQLQKRPDGTVGALLRNIERDLGAQLGIDRLARDGNTVKLMAKRRGQTEEREAVSGTYDPTNGTITLVFPGRGGSYDFTRDSADSNFYPRGKNPGRYVYWPPLQRNDGWTTGSVEDVGIDRAAIEGFVQGILDMPMDSIHAPQVHALLIARHGKLVLEEYFHGEHRDKLHETRSASKSVTATLVGAAIQAGAPLDLSSPVYKVMSGGAFPADLEPRKRAMTLEHLLTMSSGFFCDDDNNPDAPGSEDKIWESGEPDLYRYSLNVPMARQPGEKAIYCSMSPNLALGMVDRATGEHPVSTFERLIAVPMKINHYGWGLDDAGNAYGGGGAKFLPRDFTKFGQLMLDGGVWQGRRILRRDFVARASSPRVQIGDRGYGYLWWMEDVPYKNRTVRAFAALGSGGQVMFVFPEFDLVIAGFSGSYRSRGWSYFGGEAFATFCPR